MSYGSKEYWEAEYAAHPETVDDWLQTWGYLRPLLGAHVPPAARVLVLGCGNSPLGEQMWDDGYRDVLGVDFSPSVIAQMGARAGARPGLRYREMDVRALALDDCSVDAVIDKGTLDAVICSPDREEAVADMVREAQRVLSPEGIYVCISLRPPRNRLHLFAGFAATVERIDKPRRVDGDEEMNSNWVYLLRPTRNA